jgi:amino acid permease
VDGHQGSSRNVSAVILLILGVAALAVGVVYFTVAADKLPSFMGHIAHSTHHRTKRAAAAVIIGVLLLAGSLLAVFSGRSSAPSPTA